MSARVCKRCGVEQPLERFFKSQAGIRHVCLACTYARRDELNARRRSKAQGYGITLEQLEVLACRPCQICGLQPSPGKPSFVDHDHATNTVRGALCSRCNSGLGYFHDNPERLEAAADYLEMTVHRVIDAVE